MVKEENPPIARKRLTVILLIVAIVFSAVSLIAAFSFSELKDFQLFRPSPTAAGSGSSNVNIVVTEPPGGRNG